MDEAEVPKVVEAPMEDEAEDPELKIAEAGRDEEVILVD